MPGRWAVGTLRILAGLLVGATSVFVALPRQDVPAWIEPFIPLGLLTVGIVAAAEAWMGFQSLPWSIARRRNDARIHLRDLLKRLHEKGALTCPHYYMLSAHVWEVPRWYRYGFPLWLRRRGKALYRRVRRRQYMGRPSFRPSLKLLAYRTDRRNFAPSGLKFRKGKGLIGVVLTKPDPSAVVSIDYEASEYTRLRKAGSTDQWADEPFGVTLGLEYDVFLQLSAKYGQALAVQLVGSGGEAIGALTVEAERGYPESLVDNDALLTMMLETAQSLALRLRRLPDVTPHD